MNIKKTQLIYSIYGLIVGSIIPIGFILLDLNQLEMVVNAENFFWVLSSQNIIQFSSVGFPLIFLFLAILYSELQIKNKELENANEEIGNMAHSAGMAEIASEVMHNVGNVLTSVVMQTEKISRTISKSNYKTISQANEMLNGKTNFLKSKFEEDPEFEKLLNYYMKFGKQTLSEYEKISKMTEDLKLNLTCLTDILVSQQKYATSGIFAEQTDFQDLIERATEILSSKIKLHQITLKVESKFKGSLTVERNKIINILINLIKNSIESIVSSGNENKDIVITICEENEFVLIVVKDYGLGISENGLKNIFQYGFTTKKEGSGFGLHSCFNLAKTFNGHITVQSKALGEGAIFSLYVPKDKP